MLGPPYFQEARKYRNLMPDGQKSSEYTVSRYCSDTPILKALLLNLLLTSWQLMLPCIPFFLRYSSMCSFSVLGISLDTWSHILLSTACLMLVSSLRPPAIGLLDGCPSVPHPLSFRHPRASFHISSLSFRFRSPDSSLLVLLLPRNCLPFR